jgi:hypothetical protein
MLNLFEKLKIDDENLHRKYLYIRDNLAYTGEQSVLNDWVDGFQDRDNKIIKEFQTTFHSSFWEFYLFALFKEAGFEIDFSKNRPDFIIEKPFVIYIEAVVANIKKDGQQEENRNLDDILSMIKAHSLQEDFDDNMRESITRYSNAILSKSNKYTEYSKDNKYDICAPYVVALSGYEQLNYGNNFYYAMLALLYGCYYDNLNDKYNNKENIIKPNTESSIPIGLFLDDKMAHISAIIFSCTLTLGKLTSLALSQKKTEIKLNSVLCIRHDFEPPHFKIQLISPENPEHLSDGIFVFHNPFAKNPLPDNLFEKTNVVNVKFNVATNDLYMEGNNLPVVSRLNLFAGEFFLKAYIQKIFSEFNQDIVFIFAKVLFIEDADDFNGFDIEFEDIDDNISFTINFSTEKFDQYKVEENQIFFFTFKLMRNPEIEIESLDQFKRYQSLKKLRCFSLDECQIIDIKKCENLTTA